MADKNFLPEDEWGETIWYELMTGEFYRDTGGVLHRKAMLVVDDKSIAFAVVCEEGPTLMSVAYRPDPKSKVWRRIRRSVVSKSVNPPDSYTEDGSVVFGC